jgi:hypothetical protein
MLQRHIPASLAWQIQCKSTKGASFSKLEAHLALFCMLPPYASVRWLEESFQNCIQMPRQQHKNTLQYSTQLDTSRCWPQPLQCSASVAVVLNSSQNWMLSSALSISTCCLYALACLLSVVGCGLALVNSHAWTSRQAERRHRLAPLLQSVPTPPLERKRANVLCAFTACCSPT